MPRDGDSLDRTTLPVWDVSGTWPTGTGTDVLWPSDPVGNAGARVGVWNVSVWEAPNVVWGPASAISTQTRFDPYNGLAVWDSGDVWETDFWLVWGPIPRRS
jgi:hypothetical protein